MWANSGRWWRTEEPDVPQSIGSQSISRDWRLNTTSCVLNTYVVGGDVVDSSNPCYLLWVQLEAPTSSCTAASPGSVLQTGTDAQWLPCWRTWQRICQQCGTWVPSLGREDPPEKGKATHSTILAWRIPWTTVYGVPKSRTGLSNSHFK